jgi:hypothetical protein
LLCNLRIGEPGRSYNNFSSQLQWKNSKKENHARSGFNGSVPLINTIAIFRAVSYNDCDTSFVTYLMDLVDLNFLTAGAVAMILEYILGDCKMLVGMTVKICWNCTEKIRITVVATNSYNISDLKLQALQSIVTISQI